MHKSAYTNPMVLLEEVHATYRPVFRKPVPVLRGVTLALEPGEVAVIVGPNGAGKTTLLRVIAGLIRPDRGAVRVLGRVPWRERPALMRRVGVMLGARRTFRPRWTVRDVLEFGAALYRLDRPQARIEALLARFRLEPYAHQLVSALSTGTHQRLALAFSLVHEPAIWILDEPTLGLDVDSRELLLAEIAAFKRRGGLVVLTSHDPNLVNRTFDRVFYLEGGRLRAAGGGPSAHLVRVRVARPVDLPQVVRVEGEALLVPLAALPRALEELFRREVPVLHVESVSVLEVHRGEARVDPA